MAKKGVYESPQTAKDGLGTGKFGGTAPDARAVMKSANARAGKRHKMAPEATEYADEGVLPNSGGESLDKDGVKNTGYITKKGLEFGADAFYNVLPPGMNIEDQENIDSRKQPFYEYSGGLSYPMDGGFPGRESDEV